MALRTYYWNTRKTSFLKYYKYKILNPNRKVFKYGNSGDIFNIDLIKFLYNEDPQNILDEGNRLLLVGSILSVLKNDDVVCGIGWKGNELNLTRDVLESINLMGVRGPLTKEFFEKNLVSTKNIKFEYDPGLLIKEVYNIDISKATSKNVIFIPHYRDSWIYSNNYPKNLKIVSIDNSPKQIAAEILKSKVVYTSSLHGIIFSHALGKECVFVNPQTDEPIFKYRDYFLSIGQSLPKQIKNINDIRIGHDKGTVLEKNITMNDFVFPDKDDLRKSKIIF